MKEKIIKEEMFNHLTLDSNQKKQIKAVFAKPENESVDFSERDHPSSSTEEILPNNFFRYRKMIIFFIQKSHDCIYIMAFCFLTTYAIRENPS